MGEFRKEWEELVVELLISGQVSNLSSIVHLPQRPLTGQFID